MTEKRIQLLPEHVANQIAAGEVVQRPASVVKELMENAIDAGSDLIQLIVKEGGKTLIQVTDNGSGIPEEQVELAFQRHATSKIRQAEDLFQIQSKGFRGEALASIAAIAHVELQTRQAQDETGLRVRIEGGTLKEKEACASQVGSSFSVKQLFYNIPARRNFLKSDAVELRHITEEFQRIALAHPEVAFRFYSNGNVLFDLPPGNLKLRLVHVLGAKTKEKLVPVEEETDVVNLSGFILKPDYAKKSRGEQYFFVNNRFVKSPYLHHAVMAAYEGLLPANFYPGYFLFLEVDPARLDVNIHPTKTEVKFEDEQTLYAILRSAIKHSLGQFQVAPTLDFNRDPNLDTPYEYESKNPEKPLLQVDSSFNPFKDSSPRPARVSKEQIEATTEVYESGFSSLLIEEEPETTENRLFEEEPDYVEGMSCFQWKRKYLLVDSPKGLLAVDQSRAHQRVIYETFLGSMTVQAAASQQLLFPLELHFSKKQMMALTEIEDSLKALGFDFAIGEDQVLSVHGIPSLLPEGRIPHLIEQLIADYEEGMSAGEWTQAELLARTLCRSVSIRSGDVLEKEAQQALLSEWLACKETLLSPFHKLIYIRISEGDIHKKLN
ncbi:DNA mismatch repair endonuclease MutL [Aureicoccus marinus]|uniref:DNA mismatch repair protein MutL n=1 Tax=Aureicoccus marinus TaxID=754435 RepID=A0A2S7T5H6_9FLAO|nr:DNA mismatch repair endonuclease MutL [Aureicoccus marinus]PQJ14706.1 DNA mismatch repair protein MutL [Aureicoccus marinus]